MPRIVAVVPARLASTRLPRKMLQLVAGKPLLQWTVEAALRCPQLEDVIVATDAEEIGALCDQQGWRWRMTDAALPSGTDRMHAVVSEIPADICVNIQGDEPLLQPAHIAALLRPFPDGPHVQVSTLKTRCRPEEVHNPNAVKVVTSPEGRALYFSRAAIPYDRDGQGAAYWKHLGLYAYRRDALMHFAALPPSPLECIERLEQLRLLENRMVLYVEEVEGELIGVDTAEDLLRVQEVLQRDQPTTLSIAGEGSPPRIQPGPHSGSAQSTSPR